MDVVLGMLLNILSIVGVIILVLEVVVLLGYLFIIVWRIIFRNSEISKALSLPEGEIFDYKNKSTRKALSNVEDILKYMENPSGDPIGFTIGEGVKARIDKTTEALNRYGLIRKLRFIEVDANRVRTGDVYRKWNYDGKEWRACEINCSFCEQFVDKTSGRPIETNYYPVTKITFAMSRRLTKSDKETDAKKDKWGRKVYKGEKFYEGKKLTNCPSCGAPLPEDLKDVICPNCKSTIYADFYDWQVETLEIEPVKLKVRGFFMLCKYLLQPGTVRSRVVSPKKGPKIPRFSENDFRRDVYNGLLASENDPGLIDMMLGTINISSVNFSDRDVILGVKVPVYRVAVVTGRNGANSISTTTKDCVASFIRTRNPGKFNEASSVVSAEKKCPACGGPFSPNEKGCCTYCGTFLFKDNLTWKRYN